jgi:hypothetical protein
MNDELASGIDAVVRSALAHLFETTSEEVSALRIEHLPNF